MNRNICKIVVQNREGLVPHIFTHRQVSLISKYIKNKPLTSTEKTYLYSAIKKKTDALSVFHENFYTNGKDMLPKRVSKAKTILKELGYEKAFISGTFLFKKEYNDIDVFIISKKRTQYRKDTLHLIFITESDLKKPMFASALNYSVSTFQTPKLNINKKRSELDDIIMAYELSVSEIIDKEDTKAMKFLIIDYFWMIKHKLLDSYELHVEINNIRKNTRGVEILKNMVVELIMKLYSPRYVYDILAGFTKKLEKLIKEYKSNKSLIIYKNTFDEIKNACRKAKT